MRSVLRIAFGAALALTLGSCEDPVLVDVDRGLHVVWLTPPPETLREGDAATVAVQVLDRDDQPATDFDGVTVSLRFTFATDSQPGTSCEVACTATVAQGQVSMTVDWLSAGSWSARACVTPPAGGDELCAERPLIVEPVVAVLVAYPTPSAQRRVPFPLEVQLQLPNGDAVTDLAPRVRLRFTSPPPESVDRVHCPEAGPVCEHDPVDGVVRLTSVVILDLATTTLEACVLAPNGHERCDPAGARTFDVVLPPASLRFVTEPSGGSVAVPFATQPVIEVLEPDGTRRTDFAGLITVSLTANQVASLFAGTGVGGVTSFGTVSQPATGGLATFAGLRLLIARPSSTLDATAEGATDARSAAFAVTLDPSHLSITKESGDAQYGLVGTQLPVVPAALVIGPLGEPVTGVRVEFSVAGGGSVSFAAAVTGPNGMAPAGAWTLGPNQGLNTLTASADGFAPAVFTADGVVPMRLAYITPPSDVVAGDDMSPVVIELRDIQQRRIFGATDAVTVVGPGDVTTTHAAVDGRAAFTDLRYTIASPPGGTNSLSATATRPGPTLIFFSGPFRVSPRLATARTNVIAGIGQTVPVGTATPIIPAVSVTDAYGNPIAGRSVTFAVTAGDGSVTNPQQVTDTEGEARPTAWTVGATPGANTLTITAEAIEGFVTITATGTSVPIAFEQLAFISGPTNIVAGQIMAPVVIELQDAQGRRAFGATDPIRVVAGATSLLGTLERDAVDGRVTFDELSATQAGTFTFAAADPRFDFPDPATKRITADFTVSPDLGTLRLEMASTPDTATMGRAVTPVPRVRLADAYSNGIDGRPVTFTALITGSVTDPDQTTANGGYASPTAWIIGSVGFNMLNVTSEELAPISFFVTGLVEPFEAASVSAGFDFTCAPQRTTGIPYCWGNNIVGQLGDGTQTTRQRPVELAGGLISMSQISTPVAVPFFSFACGLAGSAAYCWGVNHQGQLGIGTADADLHATPIAVSGGHAFQQITTGSVHACALDTGGEAWCWGFSTANALGRGSEPEGNVYEPGRVAGLHTFTRIDAGTFHTCGLTTSGEIWCWGTGGPALGTGDPGEPHAYVPVRVTGDLVFTDVSAGANSTCGISAGSVYCWGSNVQGQLGTEDLLPSATPVAVHNVFGISQRVSVGAGHACAVTAGLEAYCWGRNESGQLGDGTTTQRTAAVRVAGGAPFSGGLLLQSISTGAFHSCGVRQSGETLCWGLNTSGRLGDGTTAQRLLPARVVRP